MINYLKVFMLLYFTLLCNNLLICAVVILIINYHLSKNIKQLGLYLIIILIYLVFSIYQKPIDNTLSGKVISISDNYMIIKNESSNFLAYVDDIGTICLNDTVIINGSLADNQTNSTFYSNGYDSWLNYRNIDFTVFADSVKLSKKSNSFKSIIQRRIEGLNITPITKDIMYKTLLNTKINDDLPSILFSTGLHIAYLIFLIKKVLKLFFTYKQIIRIELIIYLILNIILGFNFSLFRLLFYAVLRNLNFKYNQILGIYGIFTIIFFRDYLFQISFVIAIALGIIQVYSHNKYNKYPFLLLINSFYFYQINLIQILLFNTYKAFFAIITIFSILNLFIPLFNFDIYINCINNFQMFIDDYTIYGKVNEIFLIIIMYLLLRRTSYKTTLFTFVMVYLGFLINVFNPFAEVSFINVKQGDSMLIKQPFNQGAILIDTGKENNYMFVENFLKAKGIKKIDHVIITHTDADHYGGYAELITDFNVKNTIYQPVDDLNLNGLDIDFLNVSMDYEDINANSLVTYFTINKLNFLLLADTDIIVEKEILSIYDNLNVDIVKLGHHGSKYSTSNMLLEQNNISLAIISCGYNSYGHPSDIVLDKLKLHQTNHVNTMVDGDITILFTKIFNVIITSGKQFDIIK